MACGLLGWSNQACRDAKDVRIASELKVRTGTVIGHVAPPPLECHLWGGHSKSAIESCSILTEPQRKGTDLS